MIANCWPRGNTQFYAENYLNSNFSPGSYSPYVMSQYWFSSMFRVASMKVGNVSKDSGFSSPSIRILYWFGE